MGLDPQENKTMQVTADKQNNQLIFTGVTEKDFIPEYLKYLKEYLCDKFGMEIDKTKICFK